MKKDGFINRTSLALQKMFICFQIHLSVRGFTFVEELADGTSADCDLLNNYIQNELMRLLLEAHEWKTDYSIENISFCKHRSTSSPVANVRLKSSKFTNQKDLIDKIDQLIKESYHVFEVVKEQENVIPPSRKCNHKAIIVAVLSILFVSVFLIYYNEPDERAKKVYELKRMDSYCYETRGVKDVIKSIEIYKYVTVTGVPGSGKTTAIQHAALYLHDRFKYEIHIIGDFNLLLTHIDLAKKQVFVLNDPFGVYDIDRISLRDWNLLKGDILFLLNQTKNIKLLTSVRLSIINNHFIRQIELFNHKDSHIVYFNLPEYELSPKEMLGMLRTQLSGTGNYVSIDPMIELKNHNRDDYIFISRMFPLLSKVYADNYSKGFYDLMFTFSNILKSHFEKIRDNNQRQFCGLVLIAMFGGEVNDDYFNPLSESIGLISPKEARLRDAVMNEFAISMFDLQNILREIMVLNGTYLWYNERLGIIKFSHSIYLDVVTYLHNNIMIVLKFSAFSFVMKRVRISKPSKDDSHVLLVKTEKEIRRLSEKLGQDLLDDPNRAGELINYPHIDNEIIISSMEKYLDQKRDIAENLTLINTMFKTSMLAIAERRFSCFDYINSAGKRCIHGHKFIKILLQKKADSNIPLNECGDPPILVAAITGNEALAEILVENGADVQGKNCVNQSVFHFVFESVLNAQENSNYCSTFFYTTSIRSLDMASDIQPLVTFFVSKGVSINASDANGTAPLHRLMRIDNVDILPYVKKLILHAVDVNAKDNTGMTPVHYLANSRINNAPQILELLINSTCNVLAVDNENNSVLHLLFLPIQYFENHNEQKYPLFNKAVFNKKELAKMFIKLGVKVNSTNKFGQTALHTIVIDPSCYYRQHDVKPLINYPFTRYLTQHEFEIMKEIIQLYVNEGGNINALDNDGNHVLHSLPCLPPQYTEDMLKFLIKHKADMNIKDKDNRTILHLMFQVENSDQYSLQFAKLVFREFADINAKDIHGRTVLHYIPIHHPINSLELTRLFLNKSIDVNALDKEGKTALDYLLMYSFDKRNKLVQMILTKYINVNVVDKEGRTVLHYLVQPPSDKTNRLAELFVERYANVNFFGKKSRNALHYLSMFINKCKV